MITIPTRVIPTSKSLVDHIISNEASRVVHSDVLPSPSINDHDVVYAMVNVLVIEYAPCNKYIRNERQSTESAFKNKTSPLYLWIQNRLAQLGERRSAEQEAVGSNPGRTNTQGL